MAVRRYSRRDADNVQEKTKVHSAPGMLQAVSPPQTNRRFAVFNWRCCGCEVAATAVDGDAGDAVAVAVGCLEVSCVLKQII